MNLWSVFFFFFCGGLLATTGELSSASRMTVVDGKLHSFAFTFCQFGFQFCLENWLLSKCPSPKKRMTKFLVISDKCPVVAAEICSKWSRLQLYRVSVESTSRSGSATREPNQSLPIFLHFCYPALLLSTQHSHTAGSIRAAADDDNNKQPCCVCVCVCVLSCRQIEFSSPVCRAAVQHLTSDPAYRCVCACMCIHVVHVCSPLLSWVIPPGTSPVTHSQT